MRRKSVSWFNQSHYQVRIPKFLLRLCAKLTREQRNLVTGYYWSFNFGLSLLFILAAISITVEHVERVVFEFNATESAYEDVSFNLPEELDLGQASEMTIEEPLIEMPTLTETTFATPELSIPELNNLGSEEVRASSADAVEASDAGTGEESGLSGHESGLVADTNRKVSQAGGSLDGVIRISLSFPGDDDLDLHLSYEVSSRSRRRESNMLGLFPMTPMRHLFFAAKQTEHAELDVDANATHLMQEPCENIVFHTKPPKTRYTIALDNFTERGIPDATPYVIVVKYGIRTKVFEGKLKPFDRMKEIWSFRY